MIFLIVFGSIFLALLIIFFLLLLWIYKKFFYSKKKGRNNEYNVDVLQLGTEKEKFVSLIDKIRQVPYEDLWIKSHDGLKLHGYFYENKKSNHFILLFNGYRGIPRRDYCGKGLQLMAMGKNVILCDQRAHGLSEGHVISLGRKEQYDVVSWVNFVQEKWGKNAKITVGGTSMGASVVLLASDKLPPEVSIFADSAYCSQKDLIEHLIKYKKLNPKIFWPIVYLSALLFGHFKLKDDASINVSKSKNKILIFHCTEDIIVPIKTVEKLFTCNEEHVQVVKFEGLNHAFAFYQQAEKYQKVLSEFLG